MNSLVVKNDQVTDAILRFSWNIYNSYYMENLWPAVSTDESYGKSYTNNLNTIQDGHFRGCSRMGQRGRGCKNASSLKSATHILQL